MTDKTKPWLSASHPETIACKAAGLKLYSQLIQDGVDLRGVGVTTTDDNQSAAISVYAFSEADANLVPNEFEGYTVKVIVTGEIVAL